MVRNGRMQMTHEALGVSDLLKTLRTFLSTNIVQVFQEWNNVPVDIITSPFLATFKSKVYSYLLN